MNPKDDKGANPYPGGDERQLETRADGKKTPDFRGRDPETGDPVFFTKAE
jgi:hypothetical protein